MYADKNEYITCKHNHCEFDKATLIGNVKTYFLMGIIFEKKFKLKI